MDGSPATGPSLAGAGRKYDRSTLMEWIQDPEIIYRREKREPIGRGVPPMPRQDVTHPEAEALAEYLRSLNPPNER